MLCLSWMAFGQPGLQYVNNVCRLAVAGLLTEPRGGHGHICTCVQCKWETGPSRREFILSHVFDHPPN